MSLDLFITAYGALNVSQFLSIGIDIKDILNQFICFTGKDGKDGQNGEFTTTNCTIRFFS